MGNVTKISIKDMMVSRALEVLEVLGGKLPDNCDLYESNIILLNESGDISENYLEYGDDSIRIVLENNGHRYYWRRSCQEGNIEEYMNVDYGSLNVFFFQTKLATLTSGFYLYNDGWGSPKIFCDVENVSIGSEDNKKVFPNDYYFDVFSSYMKNKKSNNILVTVTADDPDVADNIIKMFEKPIKEHVADLKINDQSWRFSYEKENILSNYSRSVGEHMEKYLKAIEDAFKQLDDCLQISEKNKNDDIRSLEILQQKHNHKVR